jgi:hypothetical protein
MDHKYSTYVIIGCMVLIGIVYLISAFASEDLDQICNTNNSTLYRLGGVWICGNITSGINGINAISIWLNNSKTLYINSSYPQNINISNITSKNIINTGSNINDGNSNTGKLINIGITGGSNETGSIITLGTGNGGSSVSGVGKAGGTYTGTTGSGSNAYDFVSDDIAGNGGNYLFTTGNGGNAKFGSSIITGGKGGDYTIQTGSGGTADSGSGFKTGGSGGDYYIKTGSGGTGTTVSGTPGNFYIFEGGVIEFSFIPKRFSLVYDNSKIYFGESADASIYYDGVNMIINPKEVGSGKFKVLSGLNATEIINTQQNFSVNNIQGITGGYTILKDVDLIGLTKTYCNLNFTGGILYSSTC